MPAKLLARYKVVTANFATAGLKTLTRARRRRITRMARAVFAQNPDMGTLTEVWHPDVRAAIMAVAPAHIRFSTAPGSVMEFWNSRTFARERGWGSGGTHRLVVNGHLIADDRPNRNLILRDRRTGRRVRKIGFHWNPIRPALGEEAVIEGHRNQDRAIVDLRGELGHGGLIKIGAGDGNNHTRFVGTEVNGRDIDYAGDVIPDRIFVADGAHVTGELSNVVYFNFPGDHYRGRTKTGRKRAVGLGATLTLRSAA